MQDTNTMFQFPAKLGEVMVETMKKNTELSLNFLKEVEKNQREAMKTVYEAMNIEMPFDAKIWDTQINMVEQSMKACDTMYEKMSSVWKK
jgi:hypothetical protein